MFRQTESGSLRLSDLPLDLVNREQQVSDEFIRLEQRCHRFDMPGGVDSFDIHRAQHRQFLGNIDGEGRHQLGEGVGALARNSTSLFPTLSAATAVSRKLSSDVISSPLVGNFAC